MADLKVPRCSAFTRRSERRESRPWQITQRSSATLKLILLQRAVRFQVTTCRSVIENRLGCPVLRAADNLRDMVYAMRAEIERAVALLRKGDDGGLEQALQLLQNTVFSFSMRVCGQREDAEDTMQEVLMKSVPQLPKFDSPKALVVWLYKVAKNRCLMNRRKSKFAPRHELSLEELMPDRKELARLAGKGRVDPEAFAIRGEQASRLREAVQKLPPQYRIVLVLRDMEGLTDDEVAEITGVRAGTARVRLHRARLFIRKELMRSRMPSRVKEVRPQSHTAAQNRPARCKAMFAELSDYLDEHLDDSLCEELERHMKGCEPCQAFVATLEATIEQCRNLPAECPPAKAARLREKLIQQYQGLNAVLHPNS